MRVPLAVGTATATKRVAVPSSSFCSMPTTVAPAAAPASSALSARLKPGSTIVGPRTLVDVAIEPVEQTHRAMLLRVN